MPEEIESAVEAVGPVKRTVEVTVPAGRVAASLDQAYAKLGKSARIPGFRKGKVPRSVLESRFGESVRKDVVRDLIESACAQVLRSRSLDIVSPPILLEHELDDGGRLRFKAEVEIRPEFDLKTYKGLEFLRRIARVTEQDIDQAIEQVRERMAELRTEEDRVNVARGDVITFDMYAFSEGRPIEKASGEGIRLEVGSGRFPEDFEQQVIGVTRGIRTPIDVRFPDDHDDPELAGKFVRFEVTVREIKEKIVPTLTDDFVRELDWEGCDNVADMRAKVREDLERHARQEAERSARNDLLGDLVTRHRFDVPQTLVDREVLSMLRDMGIESGPREQIEKLRDALQPAAAKNVKARFVLDAIGKAEGLTVTDEEISSEVNRQIVAARDNADRVREYYSDPAAVGQLHTNLLREKTLRRIVELSTQRDEHVDRSELADEPRSG